VAVPAGATARRRRSEVDMLSKVGAAAVGRLRES
jgi:hypothetical protein